MVHRNLAGWDRLLRVAVGLAMLGLGWWGGLEELGLGPALRIFAFYPLVTGFAGWCPIYTLFRFGTRR